MKHIIKDALLEQELFLSLLPSLVNNSLNVIKDSDKWINIIIKI